MLDVKLIRDEPDGVREAMKRRREDPSIVDRVLELDAQRRKAQKESDDLRAEQKKAGKDVASVRADEKRVLLDQLKILKERIERLDHELAAAEDELRGLLLQIPNIPHESVPEGETDDDNVELESWGEPSIDFDAKDHVELGESLGIIDIERAARTSGSRFGYLKGKGALLWLALVRYALEHLEMRGFTPVVPPVLVRRDAMEGTGFLPTDEQQIYRTADDDLYLVGTSEVPLAALHMGEIVPRASLPLRYAGVSSCFRREAGAHGRDTKGIFRVHQFEKVEMFSFVDPDSSWEEHEKLVAIEEAILRALELPYRKMNVCTGELGAPAAKKIDLEAWFPSQQRYREVTSCSNTTDYQARRLNCRARGDDGVRFVHTLNGTAATSSRHVAALIENHQRPDGSIAIPEVLRPYTGFDVIALSE